MPRKKSRFSILGALLLISMWILFIRYQNSVADPGLFFRKDIIKIYSQNGKRHILNIEVAETFEQRAYGLMYRKYLYPRSGMLFTLDHPSDIDMWMKNTYIPLDMVFINRLGVISKIVQNTKPESLDIISSGSEVIAVIELNAMATKDMHINVGDYVSYNGFKYDG